ncbi:hypothetical protein Nepgr_016308 [Nepenthes gracilis]|uniref:Uncharacterized protein n=1 Tax=Nepenthes gracilis TaxID=150966 RepID=A0AAD3SNZ1_NEPGR|nr:hypothetical protein Nepgr_016308 [Nepenthes gracilis]
MGFDPMTHRPRTDIFSSLPHLIALASLKGLMEQNPREQHAVRLQAELAQLQYIQCLLQPQTSLPTFTETDTFHFLNSICSLKENSTVLPETPYSLIPSSIGAGFSHLPGLESRLDNINEMGQPKPIVAALSQEDNSPASPRLPLSSSQSPSTPPPTAAPSPVVETMMMNPEEVWSNFSGRGRDTTASFWPDHLLDDPLFYEIAN